MLSKKLPEDVLLLALRFRTELKYVNDSTFLNFLFRKANPFVVDPASLLGVRGTLHPLLAAELTKPRPASKPRHTRCNTAVNYPAVLLAEEADVFSWDDVPSAFFSAHLSCTNDNLEKQS